MGGKQTKQAKNEKTRPEEQGPLRGNAQNDIKDVLLLYRASDQKQLQVVRSFRDALIGTGQSLINIYKEIDIAEDVDSFTEDLEWLRQLNNVVLIRLSPDGVADLESIIREKRFVENGGILHDKILAVSFGKTLPRGWLPSGVKRRTRDLKDFCLGFKEGSELTIDDFERAEGNMNAIVRAIVAVR